MRTKIDIRRAITERGYTITSFCQKFNLKTQNIIQNYIKGNPTIKRLEDFCEKLDCDITDLFYPIDDSDDAKKNVLLFNKEKEEGKESDSTNTEALDIKNTVVQIPDAEPAVNTTTFCPHCGAKVRVGVVLLPEE
jgi:hypothetical protein|nr:MAG TPA: Cro/C1-type HTH DNA-binding domain protein [Caudoviricetes sp.]